MAKQGDRLSFRDAVRTADAEEDQVIPVTDEEQQTEPLLQEESLPPGACSSLPVYNTIHR